MKPISKHKSDFDEFVSSARRKALVEKHYKELSLSEMLLALMEQEAISVRSLAKEIGVSPTVIQGVRSGKKSNITLDTLLGLTAALGAKIKIEYDNKVFVLTH